MGGCGWAGERQGYTAGMDAAKDKAKPLAGWCVVLCRPVGQNADLARRLRALGAEPLCLPSLRIVAPDDPDAAREALAGALAADVTVFTSPAAVRMAARLLARLGTAHGAAVAVGEGTARALRGAGWRGSIAVPARADSEGVLALPALAVAKRVGLVTAPGGREAIAPALAARGSELRRAEVYRRQPTPLSRAAVRRLPQAGHPLALLASSAQAVDALLAALALAERTRLLDAVTVASSARLAGILRGRGFAQVLAAPGPRPAQLVAVLQGFVAADGSCSIRGAARR
jgi:uroporphyrinogen-III synthase